MVDKKYEAERNELIPDAEVFADNVAGPRPRGNEFAFDKWGTTGIRPSTQK